MTRTRGRTPKKGSSSADEAGSSSSGLAVLAASGAGGAALLAKTSSEPSALLARGGSSSGGAAAAAAAAAGGPDVEKELSLRGELILEQRNRIVELETELTLARAEIHQLHLRLAAGGGASEGSASAGGPGAAVSAGEVPAGSTAVVAASAVVADSAAGGKRRRSVDSETRGTARRSPAKPGKRGTGKSGEAKGSVMATAGKVAGQSRYWTPEEHQRFLEGLELYGSKDVKSIAEHVGTRNATQVRTHSQKYFLRLMKESASGGSGATPVKASSTPAKRARGASTKAKTPAGRQSKRIKVETVDMDDGNASDDDADSDADDAESRPAGKAPPVGAVGGKGMPLAPLDVDGSGAAASTIDDSEWTQEDFVLLDKGLKAFANRQDMKEIYRLIADHYITKRTAEEVRQLHAYCTRRAQAALGELSSRSSTSGTGGLMPSKGKLPTPHFQMSPSSLGSAVGSGTGLIGSLASPPGGSGSSKDLLGPESMLTLSPQGAGPVSHSALLTPLASPGSPLSPSFLSSLSPGSGGAGSPRQHGMRTRGVTDGSMPPPPRPNIN